LIIHTVCIAIWTDSYISLILNNSYLYFFAQCTGTFELVPSGEVYVCNDTGPNNRLEVVCRSNYSRFLKWNLTFPAAALNSENINSFTRRISSNNRAGYVSPLQQGNNNIIDFEFAVTQNPLTSVASTNQISPVLNGSIIMCTEDPDTTNSNSAELVLHVVNTATAGLSV
jgi:hypothetical protein